MKENIIDIFVYVFLPKNMINSWDVFMKVILDTNFLIEVIKNKVRIFEQIHGKLFVVDKVVLELKDICKGKGKDGTYAKISLELIKNLEVLESLKSADAALVDYSKKGYIILTQDRKLRERIKKVKGKSGYLKQKRFVEI